MGALLDAPKEKPANTDPLDVDVDGGEVSGAFDWNLKSLMPLMGELFFSVDENAFDPNGIDPNVDVFDPNEDDGPVEAADLSVTKMGSLNLYALISVGLLNAVLEADCFTKIGCEKLYSVDDEIEFLFDTVLGAANFVGPFTSLALSVNLKLSPPEAELFWNCAFGAGACDPNENVVLVAGEVTVSLALLPIALDFFSSLAFEPKLNIGFVGLTIAGVSADVVAIDTGVIEILVEAVTVGAATAIVDFRNVMPTSLLNVN